MKSWNAWFRRRRNGKRINQVRSRRLGSEFLEPRQLLAGDILQAALAPLDAGSEQVARVPRAPLAIEADVFLSLEGDSNERQLAAVTTEIANTAVAGATNGNFIVVRQQLASNGSWEIYGQRYDVNGDRVGSTFRVNHERRGHQINPQVAIASDGSFTVVFQSEVGDHDWEVMARSYDPNGVPTRTKEFAVNSNGKGDQVNPSVAYINSATFVVTWNGRGDGASADESGIFAQRVRFNDPVGDPIRVNFYKDGTQSNPVVATTTEGNFVIAWQGQGDGDASGIYMRKFFVGTGDALTWSRQNRVNSLTSGKDEAPAISINPADGSFVVAWQHSDNSEKWNIRAQAFAADNRLIGGLVEVNQFTARNQGHPAVAHIDGDYVVTWQGYGEEDSAGIYARRFTMTGEPVGSQDVLINKRNMAGSQQAPAIATAGDGVQIVWNGPNSSGNSGVFRRGLREANLSESPVIASLSDAAIVPNDSYTFRLSVSDVDTPDDQLFIRVRANNEAVVTIDPNDPTMYTITPPAGFEGSVRVWTTASDRVNEIVRESFTLTVAGNLPPDIAPIADQNIPATDNELRVSYSATDDRDQVETDVVTVTAVVDSGNATVVVNAASSELVITPRSPATQFTSNLTITLIASDGENTSRETFNVILNTQPVVDLNGAGVGNTVTTTFYDDDTLGPQSAGLSAIKIVDGDSEMLTAARVQLGILDAGFETLSISVSGTAIQQSYNASTGLLSLTGSDTIANYEKALATLIYENTATTPNSTARGISLTVNDEVQASAVRNASVTIETNDVTIDLVELAKRITESSAKFFGAAWCPNCTDQKESFEDGQKYLPFMEVTNPDRTPNELGIAEGIETYPTWEFPDGSRVTGNQRLGLLAARSGVEIPATLASQNSSPYVLEIEDDTVLVGSPLLVPIDGYDPDGDDLTFTVTSSNPDIVPTVLTGNRSARIKVEGFGDMVLELFEDRAPLATARMIQLATETMRTVTEGEGDDAVEREIPFYQDIIFHRVLNDFVIQAGDPLGTGSGGSDLGDFDDQFDVDLQHNRTGLLSMAKTNDDTNDSQFFITEGPSRHLDFNHTVFGLLTEGESNRDAISNTDVVGGRPVIGVTIEGVDIFEDHENAVVMLKANEGATGTSTITVTARDGSGATFVRTFEVTLEEDTSNGGPFLVPFDDELVTPIGVPITIDVDAIDIEGDAVFFDDNGAVTEEQGAFEIDNETGVITVTPADGFSGYITFVVGVRPADGEPSDTNDTFDAQEIQIAVGDVERLFLPVVRGSADDEDLLGTRTDLVAGAPAVTVNEHINTELDYSDYSNPPTYGPHHAPVSVAGNSITPRPTGVYKTQQPDEDLVHNLEHGHVWISYNPLFISAADLTALETFVNDGGTNAGVILTPRSGNTSVIAVASWTHLLTLDEFDDATIREFVNTNRGHAPEGFLPSGQRSPDAAGETLDDGFPHTP